MAARGSRSETSTSLYSEPDVEVAPVEEPVLAVTAESDVAAPSEAVLPVAALEPFEPQAARTRAAPSVATMDRGRRRGRSFQR